MAAVVVTMSLPAVCGRLEPPDVGEIHCLTLHSFRRRDRRIERYSSQATRCLPNARLEGGASFVPGQERC
jgi:hypothetical protein